MSRIKQAAGLRELASVTRRSGAALADNPLLLVAALAKLARLAADPAAATTAATTALADPAATTATAERTRTPPAATAPTPPPTTAGPGAAPSATPAAAAAAGTAAPDQDGGKAAAPGAGDRAGRDAAGAVLSALLPLAPAAVSRMRIGELSSCAWSLGKLRPLWDPPTGGAGELSGGAAAALGGIMRRLAADWQQQQQQQHDAVTQSQAQQHQQQAVTLPLVQQQQQQQHRLGQEFQTVATSGGGASGSGGAGEEEAAGDSSAVAAPAAAAEVAAQPLWAAASSQDVANLAWGLARCGLGPAVGGGGGGSSDATGAAATAAAAAGAWAWLAGAAGDVLWSGQGREVANLAWAFATVGSREPQVFGNLQTALLHPRRGPDIVRQLREEECTALMWALAVAYGRGEGRRQRRGGGGATAAAGAAGHEFVPPPAQPVARVGGAAAAAATAAVGAVGWDVGGVRIGLGGGSPVGEEGWAAAAAAREALGDLELGRAHARLLERAAELSVNGKLTGRQVSGLLWSAAVLQGVTGQELDPQHLQALARRAAHTARYMDGQAAGNAAWALGTLKLGTAGALQAICTAALPALEQHHRRGGGGGGAAAAVNGAAGGAPPRTGGGGGGVSSGGAGGGGSWPLPSFSARDTVQILWACGRLGHRDERLLAAVEARLLPEAPSLDPWAVTTAAAALAALGAHSAPMLNALCARAAVLLPPSPPPQQPPESTVGGTMVGGWQQRLGRLAAAVMSAPQAAALVCSVARLEHTDSGLVDAACDALAPRLREVQPRELCSLVAALGHLEHPHAALLGAVQQHVAYDIRPYSPADLVALLYGYTAAAAAASTAGEEGSAERLFVRAAAALQRRLRLLSPEQLARLAEAYGAAAVPEDDLFVAIATEALTRPHAFSRSQMERVAMSFRALGYEDSEELLEAWGGTRRRVSGGGGNAGGGIRGSGGGRA